MQATDYKALVAAALKNGTARFNPQPPLPKGSAKRAKLPAKQPKKLPPAVKKARKHHRMTKFREARKKAGLHTGTGLPLVRRKHPELAGLDRKEYLKLFTRKQRKERRAKREVSK